jgi:hypothetical protein
MPKNLTPAMRAHLDAETTKLAAIWRITRKDGQQFFFTDHDRDIIFGAIPTARMPGSSVRRSGAMPASRSTTSTWSACSPRAASSRTRCAPACSTGPRSGSRSSIGKIPTATARSGCAAARLVRRASRPRVCPCRAAGPVAAARPEHARGVRPQLPGRPRRSALQVPDRTAGARTRGLSVSPLPATPRAKNTARVLACGQKDEVVRQGRLSRRVLQGFRVRRSSGTCRKPICSSCLRTASGGAPRCSPPPWPLGEPGILWRCPESSCRCSKAKPRSRHGLTCRWSNHCGRSAQNAAS